MPDARILVVDDDSMVLQAVSRMLTREGFHVLPAAGARYALEIIKREPRIDLVVSDIGMPDMPGTELVNEIARLSPQTARVLMTGGVYEVDTVPPGTPVLHKPISIADLIAAVKASLKNSAEISARLAGAREKSVELQRESQILRAESEIVRIRSTEIVEKSRQARRHRRDSDRSAGLNASYAAGTTARVLTARETEIVQLICDGLSSKQIAKRLGIAFKTVVCHRSNIMAKLDLHEVVGLLRWAVQQKLIDP